MFPFSKSSSNRIGLSRNMPFTVKTFAMKRKEHFIEYLFVFLQDEGMRDLATTVQQGNKFRILYDVLRDTKKTIHWLIFFNLFLIYIMNKESLKEHILKKVKFSDEELDLFLSYFKEKKVKKKQFIILPGSIAKYRESATP